MRNIVEPKDLKEFIELKARVMLCASSGQGQVYWYPGAKAAGQYALVVKDGTFIGKEHRYPTLTTVLEAYSYGIDYHKAKNDKAKDVHTEHCCVFCGCKYGDEYCTVTMRMNTQSFPCTSECGMHY